MKYSTKFFIAIMLLTLIPGVVYCENNTETAGFPVTVKDALGRTVTVEAPPERIISTIPSNTEILYDLGLKEKVIAVTTHCGKTCGIAGKRVMGGWSEPEIVEDIQELNPDLVLAFGGLQSPLVEEMDKRGITTFVFFPKTVDETLEQILLVGKITGTTPRAKGIVRQNRNKLDEIKSAFKDMPLKKRVKCVRLMSTEARVVGGASFQSDIIKKAGGINVFENINEGYPFVSFEDVRERDPDIIVFNRDDEEKAIQSFLKKDRWKDLRAAKNGKLASISCDYICHPNTRIADTVEMMARYFYPEKFPVVLKDATGATIEFFKKPRKIISLNPSATEIIHALNAKKKLIGVTAFCPFPEVLAEKENIGTILNPDVEKIVSLEPDLVLATVEGNRRSSIDSLRRAGAKVFVLGKIRRFDDIYARIGMMGEMLGAKRDAEGLILEMNKRIDLIKQKVAKRPRLKVFLQMGAEPIVTANKDTIMNEVIELAGGENIAKKVSLRYPKYSREDIVIRNPDAIIIVSMGKFGERALLEWRTFNNLKAVRDNRVSIIDSDLVCHMGPRLVDGAEEVAKILHPEAFERKSSL